MFRGVLGGTGPGLLIAMYIVNRNRGLFDDRDRVGVGSMFMAFLPAMPRSSLADSLTRQGQLPATVTKP